MCDCSGSYAKKGYQVFEQLLTVQEIQQLTAIILPVYQQWIDQNQALPDFADRVNMHSLTHPQYFRHDDTRLKLFELLANPALVMVLESLFGKLLYFHNTQLFFNPRNPDKKNYWHRDLQHSPISDVIQQQVQGRLLSLHVRIPLLAETGLELIAGTHQRWDTLLEQQVRFALHGYQSHEDLPDSQLMTLEPGDVLVFDAQMLHRGRYDLDTERLALDICIGLPHRLIQDFMDVSVQPTAGQLAQLAQLCAVDWYIEAARLKAGVARPD